MYIGSNAVDDIKIGSNSVDAVYLGDTQVWSAIPADVKAHIARVTADGGTVPEQAKMVSMVKKLIAANLWNNCVFFGLCLGGVKKDGNQYVSKVYDLKANADLSQATGTAQPLYQTDGSLLYDGGDLLGVASLAWNNPIRVVKNKQTVIVWVKRVSKTVTEIIFGRYRTDTTNRPYAFATSTNPLYKDGFYINIYGTDAIAKKTFFTGDIVHDGAWHQIAFTYNGTAMDGSVQGLVKLYKDGVPVSNLFKSTNLDCPTFQDVDTGIALGAGLTLTYPYTGSTALHQIYNYALTDEQILWNFNNIRPEGV